jgi:hypothetical protein
MDDSLERFLVAQSGRCRAPGWRGGDGSGENGLLEGMAAKKKSRKERPSSALSDSWILLYHKLPRGIGG